MPKALCLTGLVIAILVFLLFTVDLIMGFTESSGPFSSASMLTDILFMVASGGLAYASWTTFREQR